MLRNRGYNKNNDSRYISHLGGGIRSKLGDSSIYKSSMMKVLGDTTDDKSESSDKSSKYINKNIDKKEDVKK